MSGPKCLTLGTLAVQDIARDRMVGPGHLLGDAWVRNQRWSAVEEGELAVEPTQTLERLM